MVSRPVCREGIERLLGLAARSTAAIMCAEEDPARCHRTLLIGPALERHGVALGHIHGDGSAEGSGGLEASRFLRRKRDAPPGRLYGRNA
jgi:uncharacterized protein (DUF488 family)